MARSIRFFISGFERGMEMQKKIQSFATVGMVSLFLAGLSVWGLIQPDAKTSVSERRPLASFPSLRAETILSGEFMTGFESYALDQFPLRDSFRTLKTVTALYVLGQKDVNDIFLADGFASKLEYPIRYDSLDYAAERFRFVYESYLKETGSQVYFSVVPDKNYFMAEPNGYPSMDYEAFFTAMQERMDFASYLDITGLLSLDDYYKTDSHWRQEKITDVAAYLAQAMGTTLRDTAYTETRFENRFHGVYFGQSALPLPAETISILDSQTLRNCLVWDYESESYIPVYAMDKLEGNDAYEMYLSGSKSLLVIENPQAETDKELILFRDSYGSSLAPLLVSGYSKITVVDIRYLPSNRLGAFLDFHGQDVLFLYSTSVLNNSETIK